MRNLYLGTLLLLTVCAASSWSATAPILWNPNGVAIRQGYEIEWQRGGEMDADGNMVYVWSDTHLGDRDVYAQCIGSDGEPKWGNGGLIVSHGTDRQEDPAVIPTGFHSYIIIWNDFRNDTARGDLYGQRVDMDGNIKWAANGVLLSTGAMSTGSEAAEFRIVADGVGGAVIVWNDLRSGDLDIYALRVDSNGVAAPSWTPNGTPVRVRYGDQKQISVDSDGQGGAFVAWTDEYDSLGGHGKDIYIQRVTATGSLAFGPLGIAVCDTTSDQDSPKLCVDGSGGAFIVWQDKRSDQAFGDLFFRHITANGQFVPATSQGLPLVQLPMQKQESPRIVAIEPGAAAVIWEDTRNDPGNVRWDVYAQKINTAGQRLWGDPNGGIAVCNEATDQTEARLFPDGAGNVICTWMDERDGNENGTENIYAQKINSNGTFAWQTNGIVVCDAPEQQKDPLIRATSSSSMIAWADYRSGSVGIWYQKLNSDGAPMLTAEGDTLIWGISGNIAGTALVRNNTNRVFIFFEDGRSGNSIGATVYAQIVDTTGALYLPANGKMVCPNPEYDYARPQYRPDACTDGGSGAIVIWLDERDTNPTYRIYAQHMDQNGNLLWGNAGVAVSPSNLNVFDQSNPRIASDGAGGAFVAWSANPPANALNVYLARISSTGQLIWPDVVAVSSAAYQDEKLEDMVSDGNGGVYLSYTGGSPDKNIYAQHVDASGNLLWGTNGALLCNALNYQSHSKIASLGAESAFIVWEDQRIANTDIYAQRVNAGGQLQWSLDGFPICTAAADQLHLGVSTDAGNNIFIVWDDIRPDTVGNSSTNIYMQKVTPDGQFLYPVNGMILTMAPQQQLNPRIMADGSGGNYVLWEDNRNGVGMGSNSDVFGTHRTNDGNLSSYGGWTSNGDSVNTVIKDQTAIKLMDDFAGGAVVIWDDWRSSGKATVENLYAQRINERNPNSAVLPADPAQPAVFHLLEAYPNPFNPDVRLRYSLSHSGVVKLSLWDVMGRQVALLKDGWQRAGISEVTWDGSDFASGIYFVRLQFDGRQQQQKIVLLK